MTTVSIEALVLTLVCRGLKLAIGFANLQRRIVYSSTTAILKLKGVDRCYQVYTRCMLAEIL
jgi:hypothetical protein